MGGLDDTAATQWGVVTRGQLLAAGLSARSIEKRRDKGWLIRVHRGVYRVGHTAPCVEADYIAAVLACGAGAVLCGRAAAFLLEIIRANPAPEPEVLTVGRRVVPGIATAR